MGVRNMKDDKLGTAVIILAVGVSIATVVFMTVGNLTGSW